MESFGTGTSRSAATASGASYMDWSSRGRPASKSNFMLVAYGFIFSVFASILAAKPTTSGVGSAQRRPRFHPRQNRDNNFCLRPGGQSRSTKAEVSPSAEPKDRQLVRDEEVARSTKAEVSPSAEP